MIVVLREVIFLALILLYVSVPAQLVKVSPERPKPSDWVTIIFDATQGNKALMNHQGDVYIHTGLVIGTLENPMPWAYVQGEWGKDDPKVRMSYMGNNKYRIRFLLREFYGLPSHRNFLQMAFVFRDQSGAKIAGLANGSDIFYPDINQLAHGPLENATGRKGKNLGEMVSVSKLEDGSLILKDESNALMVKPYGDEMVHLTFFPNKAGMGELDVEKYIDPEISGEIQEESDGFEIMLSDSFRFHIFTNPIRMELYRDETLVFADERGAYFDQSDPLVGNLVGVRAMLKPREIIYETGASPASISRRGTRVYHHPERENIDLGKEQLNQFPFLISNQGYGILVESDKEGYADLGQLQPGIMEVGIRDSVLSWYIVPGREPKEMLRKISQINTPQSIPLMKEMRYKVMLDEDVSAFWQKIELPGEKVKKGETEMSRHLRRMLATGTGGVPYHFSFPGTKDKEASIEQLIREAQYKVFNPIMRGISPNADKTGALNQNIKLRQKFLPYNYTLAWEHSQKGFPLARPMYFHHFNDLQTQNIDRQFLWGESILVAPVFDFDEEDRRIYFPPGKWFDFFNYKPYQGGGWQRIDLSPGHLPVMVKEGSFIPLLPDSLSEYSGNSFELQYYPDYSGKTSLGNIYMDNGKEAQAFEKDNYLLIKLAGKVHKKGMSVYLNTSGFGYPGLPESHRINLVVLDIKEIPKKIFINGKKVELLSSFELDINTQLPDTYATYIPGRNRLDIFWNWDQLPGEISIKGKF